MHMKIKSMILLAALLGATGAAHAEESVWGWLGDFTRQNEVNAVSNAAWQEECGSCHFAYQPGLLPTQSWEKLLDAKALEDHFGENAELDADTLKEVRDFALENAADKSYYKRARKIAKSTENGEAPLRITELRYIKRKHHEIPEKMVKGNKDVKSLSYCDACHTQAKKAVFDEDTVRIPNYPDWED
ncbi:MAG: diheme cytochrome c [Gammaproteobacteria bacterium]|nr:diheme cytochrome c [Gammaproteobacteria bacterium]MBU1623689.1 diheme cytochrome c [Gammaproteobacteria bacterium]